MNRHEFNVNRNPIRKPSVMRYVPLAGSTSAVPMSAFFEAKTDSPKFTEASKLCAKPAVEKTRTNQCRRMPYSVQRYAAWYLSRHSGEQKWTSSPLIRRVTLRAVDTYVPQTGSLFNSPPATTGGFPGADWGEAVPRMVRKILPKTERRRRKTRRGRTISRKRYRSMT